MNVTNSDFTILTVSIGYNHFLEKWAECISKLQVKPGAVIIGVDNIEQKLKWKIEAYLPDAKWIILTKIKARHYGHYYNQLINLVDTTWVCKVDADDQILPSAYNDLSLVSSDIYAFGNISSTSGNINLPETQLDSERILLSNNNLLSSLSPFKKSVWEKSGFKDFIYDDWAFWIDAAQNGFSFSSSNKADYIYVEHDSQATKTSDEKYERSILLKYKQEAAQLQITKSEICSYNRYLFIPPDHNNFKSYSDLLEILARLNYVNKTDIFFLDLSSYCPNPIRDYNSRGDQCKTCETIILNLQTNFNLSITIIDASYPNESGQVLNFENSLNYIKGIVNFHKIDCVVNLKSIIKKNDNIFEIVSGSKSTLINITSGKKDLESVKKVNLEIVSQNGNKQKTINKFFSDFDSDLVIFKNIEILSNLPIQHLLEFNKISIGFSDALLELSKNDLNNSIIDRFKLLITTIKEFMSNK